MLLSLLLSVATHFQVSEWLRGRRGPARAEARGLGWRPGGLGGRAGWEGPSLCARRYLRATRLAASEPFQMNGKPWALFDGHLS